MHKLTGTKLVSYKLIEEIEEPFVPQEINESLDRPGTLKGSTYKITPTTGEGSMYITINDIVLNEGTEHEEVRPFEIFINSKNVEHVQWVAALTRVMSAVFRKGGDIKFLVDELEEVFDPKGGYFSGSRFYDSIVANIGAVLREHLTSIGVISAPEMSAGQKKLIEEKKAQIEESEGDFPPNAQVCKKCKHKAAIMMDNCLTCLNCGDGKCG